MKIFHSTTRPFKRFTSAFALAIAVALLVSAGLIDVKKQEMVVLQTPYGDMTLLLYDETPGHKENFLKLVKDGFYDDLLFHRIIQNFMIQGGDPDSKGAEKGARLGTGGPGYTLPAEIRPNFIHKKGALAAARQGDQVNPEKASSGSQFYIVHGAPVDTTQLRSNASMRRGQAPSVQYTDEQMASYAALGGTPHLDGAYTIFGEVIEGLDIIDSIAAQPADRMSRPLQDIPMNMKIIRKKWN